MHMFPQSQSATLRLHRTVVAAFFALTAGAYAAPDPYAVDTAKPARIDGYKLVWHDEFDVDGAPKPAASSTGSPPTPPRTRLRRSSRSKA